MNRLTIAVVAAVSFVSGAVGGAVLTTIALPRWAALQTSQPQAAVDQAEAKAYPCSLNQVKQSCTITPVGNGGAIRISLSAGDKPFFVFTPAGPPTTDNRPMRDDQGRLWLYSGNRSFTLTEQGGFKNVISVAVE
jgi:hypothetical protein